MGTALQSLFFKSYSVFYTLFKLQPCWSAFCNSYFSKANTEYGSATTRTLSKSFKFTMSMPCTRPTLSLEGLYCVRTAGCARWRGEHLSEHRSFCNLWHDQVGGHLCVPRRLRICRWATDVLVGICHRYTILFYGACAAHDSACRNLHLGGHESRRASMHASTCVT